MKLNMEIKAKWPSLTNQKGIILRHDNAKQTLRKIKELKWQILEHPPFSPGMTPSDFCIFWSMQNNLSGKKFDLVEDIKTALLSFLRKKQAVFMKKTSSNYLNVEDSRWWLYLNNKTAVIKMSFIEFYYKSGSNLFNHLI